MPEEKINKSEGERKNTEKVERNLEGLFNRSRDSEENRKWRTIERCRGETRGTDREYTEGIKRD